jgi:uncharacterized membrane protein
LQNRLMFNLEGEKLKEKQKIIGTMFFWWIFFALSLLFIVIFIMVFLFDYDTSLV